MKSVRHNLMYELSGGCAPEGYNRNKSPVSDEMLLSIIENFSLSEIVEYFSQAQGNLLLGKAPSLHDNGIAYCLFDSIGREVAGTSKDPAYASLLQKAFEFNIARVRAVACVVPGIRELAVATQPMLADPNFVFTRDVLLNHFPKLVKRAGMDIKRLVTKVRDRRRDSGSHDRLGSKQSSDTAVLSNSYESWLELTRLVRHMGVLRYWGIDDFSTNRFFGIEQS